MIKHSQYFTETTIAMSLVNLIRQDGFHKVIELGIGDGALSLSALKRWPNLKVEAIDIDENLCSKWCKSLYRNVKVYLGDVLTVGSIDFLKPSHYDLALCNPPFKHIKWNEDYKSLLLQASLPECATQKNISAEIVFLAMNLIFLQKKGIIAIILPDGHLTRKDYTEFRKSLINNHKLMHIVQLPDKAFSKTEARTHILFIEKLGKTLNEVPVSIMDSNGFLKDTINIKKIDLYNRMDYSFCKWNSNKEKKNIFKKSTKISIKRGSFTYKELRTSSNIYVHSNSFVNGDCLSFPQSMKLLDTNKTIAMKGDILMCRVGKRSVGKISYVVDGCAYVSDCIYRIRVPSNKQKRILKLLLSDTTKDWIEHIAHGVCSKVISKSDLEDYLSKD